MTLEFNEFVRKPFVVEAVEVTTDNIAEIAQYVGQLRHKDDGTPFIAVNRNVVPNVYRVFPGYYMTKIGDNIRCYTRKIFHQQFIGIEPDIKQWVDYINGVNQEQVSA